MKKINKTNEFIDGIFYFEITKIYIYIYFTIYPIIYLI